MKPKVKNLLLNLLVGAISIIIVLVLAEVLYRVYEIIRLPPPSDEAEPPFMQYDELLGWRPIPGANAEWAIIDRYGGRAKDENEIDRPLGEKKIVAFGDSFTFGDELKGHQAWPARLEEMVSGHGYDVVNMGVPAYGIDQMYLLYREEEDELAPDIVLAGIISWDIQRVPKSRRKAESREKPMFIFEEGELKLTNVPVPVVMEDGMKHIRWNDILFDAKRSYLLDRIWSPENRLRWPDISNEQYLAENIKPDKYARGTFLSLKIIERWAADANTSGSRLILVLIPTKKELVWYHSYLFQLKENLQAKGVEIVDCQEVFRRKTEEGRNLFRGEHPSRGGQSVIAEEVYYYLVSTDSFSEGE